MFPQLVSNSPLPDLKIIENYCKYETRSKRNSRIQTKFSQTVTKAKSLQNTLRKCYNWLLKFELIPDNIKLLSSYQIWAHVTNILKLNLIYSNETFDYLYDEGILNFEAYFLHLDY